MNLYLITYYDEDGTNQDLLVMAMSPQQAFDLWRHYYCEDHDEEEEYFNLESTVTEGDSAVEGAMRIRQVVLDIVPRALNWGSDVKTVAHVAEI